MSSPAQQSSSGLDYNALNSKYWDERAPAHVDSSEYQWQRLIADENHLSEVVEFDKPLLGSINGRRCIHLQCHIGTDTLSLARLGAREVVGIDFSTVSVRYCRELAAATKNSGGERLTFIESDVYATEEALKQARGGNGGPTLAGAYDLVYTGVGALCWIPDIKKWARLVHTLLRPGGRLFIREAHPILWTIDDSRTDGLLCIRYPYFETVEPEVYEGGDYVGFAESESTVPVVQSSGDKAPAGDQVEPKEERKFEHTKAANFNHGMGEIVSALLEVGMEITGLRDHETLPWVFMPGVMRHVGKGEWTLKEKSNRLPHSYTLQAVKRDRGESNHSMLQ